MERVLGLPKNTGASITNDGSWFDGHISFVWKNSTEVVGASQMGKRGATFSVI
jgi:hypothetical protein